MATHMAVQITVYMNEADEWQRRPLHMELLNYLRKENVAGATLLHAVGGFTGRQRVHTAGLVDAGGKLPLVLTFVDTEEHVERVMPELKRMAAGRLIVRENVNIEQGLSS
jgi:uncharacterized protein